MFKLSPVMLLLSAALPFSAIANQVSGTVLDKNNQPVANAKVSIMGSLQTVETNSKGEFVISGIKPGKVELHAAASGFAHFNSGFDLTESGLKDVKVTLTPSAIEVIDVVASPFHASNMESATPVSVLSGDALRNQQSATLGDSLAKEVGVHTNFHAGVASTPIIRGLSGPRVLITQNGLDVSDASRVGPDHSVSSEASTAEQIEVLRGPATLFYGSGEVGGVVNVVDKRVPREVEQSGEWLIEHDSVDNQKLASVNINTGSDNIAVHFDGFYRESDDYKVPVIDEHGSDKIANSGEESKGATAGASYILDNGYVGVSVGKLEREYGIPGHSHGDEEVPVFAELEQDRIQLLSELQFTDSLIDSLHTRVAYTDYEHAEIEHGVVGTIFANKTVEAKFDALHRDMNGWRGGFSLHYKRSDFSALGAEAFTPPSETETLAFAWMEERHFDDVLLQLGARVERVTIDAPKVVLPEVELHVHDDHDHDHDHDHGAEGRVFAVDQEFNPVSLSAGLVWDFTPGYNLGVSVSRSQRAPSAAELFSFGPHIGTRTYEVGAMFDLHETDNVHFDFDTKQDVELETANNIDLTFRKLEGDFGVVVNVFYNQVDNYYYQTPTEVFAPSGHEHHDHSDHDHDNHDHGENEGHDEHSDELPVYVFKTDDVTLYGFEAQFAWQVTSELKTEFFTDYVNASLDKGGDLPMIPPLRFGTKFNYQTSQFSANLDVIRYQKQDKIAYLETATDGYTMVDASIAYHLPVGEHEVTFYAKGHNLTDTEARVHSSFLKELAPRPGRSIALGIRGVF